MTALQRCRSCGCGELVPILSLGRTPLANRLLDPSDIEAPEPRYPLDLVFCPECSLLQITETVDPAELFRDYVYFSSFSDTVVENARDNVHQVIDSFAPTGLVIEIASNDGYLLQHYRERGFPVLGIEPASNIAAVAREKGIETLDEFFGLPLARRLRQEGRLASVVHASNVLAHVADLNGFVAGIAHLLADDGVAVIEVPYVVDLIEGCEFDTIYHEHLCYYSATALDTLFTNHRLSIVKVERIAIHGGTLRITVAHAGGPHRAGPSVGQRLESERAWGIGRADTYLQFAGRIETLRQRLTQMLRELREGGSRIAAYGASAKGATLLNCFGIGNDLLEYVVDRSTVKQGRLTPGTHLRIVGPEILAENAPDYLLLLSWNHADEILRQQQAYRDQGGRFIVPVPVPRIV